MVIDTSAIAAPLFKEPDAARYAQAIAVSARRFISAVTHLELVIVFESRNGEMGATLVDEFLAFASIEVTAVSPRMALHAIDAYRRFGKGRHKARLNIGDCFSYALARRDRLAAAVQGQCFCANGYPPRRLTIARLLQSVRRSGRALPTATSEKAVRHRGVIVHQPARDRTGRNRPLILKATGTGLTDNEPGINTRSGLVSRQRNLLELAGHPAAPGRSHRRRRAVAKRYEVRDVNHDGQNTGRQLCASSRSLPLVLLSPESGPWKGGELVRPPPFR